MAIMCAVVGALSSFHHTELDILNQDHRLLCAYRILAKMPTLAAMAYKTSIGQPIVYPRKNLSYAANFLHMLFADPTEEYIPNPVMVCFLYAFCVCVSNFICLQLFWNRKHVCICNKDFKTAITKGKQ